jgi:hypothetical protein
MRKVRKVRKVRNDSRASRLFTHNTLFTRLSVSVPNTERTDQDATA